MPFYNLIQLKLANQGLDFEQEEWRYQDYWW